jgi:hypothetical protein
LKTRGQHPAYFSFSKREKTICAKKNLQDRPWGANLSMCRGGRSSARDGAITPEP